VDRRPFVPRKLAESVSEHLQFPDPTVSLLAVVSGVESLLSRAFSRPQLARRYAREATLRAQVSRRAPWELRVAFKEPAGSKNPALFAIKARLEASAFPGPFEDLQLTLGSFSGDPWRQESIWSEVRREDHLRQAMTQLRSRIGVAPPVYQVRELEPWSRVPERRHALVQLSP
jgi:DNA polymerase-4/protein ImuB